MRRAKSSTGEVTSVTTSYASNTRQAHIRGPQETWSETAPEHPKIDCRRVAKGQVAALMRIRRFL